MWIKLQKNQHDNVLLIHMGGLGDVCLSESVFYSLSLYYKKKIKALGIKKYLSLFSQYFESIENIESLRWLFLFSEEKRDVTWKKIVLVGKDKNGTLRKRFQSFSRETILFIDMYPDEEKVHVEDYQLGQLRTSGYQAVKKEITPNLKPLVILYPEISIKKRKWEYTNFLELERRLKEKKVPTILLRQRDSKSLIPFGIEIEELSQLKSFLESKGGIFVSNDSGVAHLAGSCGLYTVTIFIDTDPKVWHPRGNNISLTLEESNINLARVEHTIFHIFSIFFSKS
ncbi:MAG: hypothetical protein N2513_04330 [Deltaproteobacteria bacterium]|nr:hypothetical protein [Deltaproteobacteria bacterium]